MTQCSLSVLLRRMLWPKTSHKQGWDFWTETMSIKTGQSWVSLFDVWLFPLPLVSLYKYYHNASKCYNSIQLFPRQPPHFLNTQTKYHPRKKKKKIQTSRTLHGFHTNLLSTFLFFLVFKENSKCCYSRSETPKSWCFSTKDTYYKEGWGSKTQRQNPIVREEYTATRSYWWTTEFFKLWCPYPTLCNPGSCGW